MKTPSWRSARRWILLSILLLTLGTWPTHAQDSGAWSKGTGPVAWVTHLAVDPTSPDFLLAFVTNSTHRNPDQTQTLQGNLSESWALYFSVDQGKNWQPASNDLAEVRPTLLEIVEMDGDVVAWVGTQEHGLWRSDNRGRTWRPVPIPQLQNQTILALAQDVRGRLHLLTMDRTRYPNVHLYTSRDQGHTWSHRQIFTYQEDTPRIPSGLLTDPFNPNQLYVPIHGGLMISQDAGFTWTSISLPQPDPTHTAQEIVLTTDPTQRGRLYLVSRVEDEAGQTSLHSFLSLDGGFTWQAQPTQFITSPATHTPLDPIPYQLRLDPLRRQHLVLATNLGLWDSVDGGQVWRPASGDLAGNSFLDIRFHPRIKNQWLAIGAGGIWQTHTGGKTWQNRNNGLPATAHLRDLILLGDQPQTLLARNTGPLPREGLIQPLWRSTDGGTTWKPVRLGLEGAHIRALASTPGAPQTAWALTEDGLARTQNQGLTWTQIPLPTYPLALGLSDDGWVYVGTGQGLLASSDAGATWQTLFDQGSVVSIAVDARHTVFLASYNQAGDVHLWQGAPPQDWKDIGPLPISGAIQLQAHPHQPGLLTLTAPWEGLYVSTDGGHTWQRRIQGIPPGTRWHGGTPEQPQAPNLLAFYMDPTSGEWWAARDGGGVYRSLNNGGQWQDVTGDIGDVLMTGFAHSQDGLHAATANSGLYTWQTTLTPAEPPTEVDLRIEIFWPHDFAPVTQAQQANLGLRLYRSRSLEPPPCAWSPNVTIWAAQDAEPLRRIDLATHRHVQGHPFPFWVLNDLDVTWANDPGHQLIYMARLAPGLADSYASVWIHAADARTHLPEPPQPQGLAPAGVTEMDGRILIVWPHDRQGRYAPPDEAPLVNITAALFQRDTLLALREEDLPHRVWLMGALDNQVGRRLAVGQPRQVEVNGLRYTLYDFNDIDVSLVQDPAHRWAFWLEAPDVDLTTNVWIHGSDARTIAPRMVEPITSCQP